MPALPGGSRYPPNAMQSSEARRSGRRADPLVPFLIERGRRFCSVAKTFQLRVRRELCDAWDALPEDARARVSRILPNRASFEEGEGRAW